MPTVRIGQRFQSLEKSLRIGLNDLETAYYNEFKVLEPQVSPTVLWLDNESIDEHDVRVRDAIYEILKPRNAEIIFFEKMVDVMRQWMLVASFECLIREDVSEDTVLSVVYQVYRMMGMREGTARRRVKEIHRCRVINQIPPYYPYFHSFITNRTGAPYDVRCINIRMKCLDVPRLMIQIDCYPKDAALIKELLWTIAEDVEDLTYD